jgi:hypothetical protein
VVSWDNQYLYFLRGNEYAGYDMVQDRQPGTVASVSNDWPQWPAHWTSSIDAGLYWGYHLGEKRRKAYFFRGEEYIRYDIDSNRVEEGYPLSIKSNWPGWPQHWTAVWASVDWGNGKVYFFAGTEYLRYDKFRDQVDPGYPRSLSDFLLEHQDKLNRERSTLLFEDQVPALERPVFVAAVRALAIELGLRPNWLMASMWTESGLKPSALAKSKIYVGLHQLSLELIYQHWGKLAMAVLRPDLFSGQKFSQLTPEAKQALTEGFIALGYGQIQCVGAWLRSSIRGLKMKCRSFDQLRLIGFGGVGLGAVDRAPLAGVVAPSNPRYDLSKDKKLNVAEFRAAVFDIMNSKFKTTPVNPTTTFLGPTVGSKVRHDLG